MTSNAFRLFNTPLMILPRALEVIIGAGGGDLLRGRPSGRSRPATVPDGISVIPIHGVIVSHREDAWGYGLSYEDVRDLLRTGLDDPRTSAVLLDIDTPGGVVSGAFDFADEIHAANERKPVYAFVNEMAYSAGYLLASSAKKIFLPRTGGVGSIGVRMVHVDQSDFNKKMGVKVTNLYVGERKVDFDPHSPLSKEAQESAMKELRDIYDLFADTVARNRGLNVQTVKGTEAACYMGQHAVDIGLADEVMTFDEAIDFIVEDVRTAGKTTSAARRAIGGKENSTMNIESEMREMEDQTYALRGRVGSMSDRLDALEARRGSAGGVSFSEAAEAKQEYLNQMEREDSEAVEDMITLVEGSYEDRRQVYENARIREMTPEQAKKHCQETASDDEWVVGMLALKGQKEG